MMKFTLERDFSALVSYKVIAPISITLTLLMGSPLSAQTDVWSRCSNYDTYDATHASVEYTYEIWQSWGDACIYVKDNGDFYTNWANIGNSLARKSVRPGVTNQKIDFNVNATVASGNVFYGAYGWWRNPNATGTHNKAVEYYVVENYGSYEPKDALTWVGYLTTDNGTYNIYIGNITDQPNFYESEGIKSFTQIKAIRANGVNEGQNNDRRSSGSITLADHFNKWATLGWPVGNLSEVSFKVEGYDNNLNEHSASEVAAYVSATMSTAGTYTGGR